MAEMTPRFNHFSHRHPLQLSRSTPRFNHKDDEEEAICSGCEFHIAGAGYASKYTCTKPSCGFVLHDSCFDLPREIRHAAHPKHALTLLPSPPYADREFTCDACGNSGHAFIFHCSRTNKPRSIFFFNEDDDISVSSKLLRVLAFVPSSFLKKMPTRLQDLIFLRYLSVTEWFEGLDYVVSTNRNLQTLVVSGKEYQFGVPTRLPCTIWESPQLQHFELDKSYVIDPPSMDKDNMRTLSWREGLKGNWHVALLPQLEVLKFENAFHGKVWEVEEGLFYRLKLLLLEDKTLKQWRVDEDSFQCLKYLVLRSCYCLEEIPMNNITTLESIELQWCCPVRYHFCKAY
nr:putative late blight resistance protein homolog R1A-4 [Ipomoea batatas]